MWGLIMIMLINYFLWGVIFILRLLTKIKCEYIDLFTAFFIPVWGLFMLFVRWHSNRNADRGAERIDLERPTADEEKKTISYNDSSVEVVPISEAITINKSDTTREMMLDAINSINRSILIDDDDMKEKIVPLEEALVVNDTATRRALIIDVLYSNPSDFVSQLFDAKANGDTEVVHYAATALTEIQKEYDLQFQDIMARKVRFPDDEGIDIEYRRLLEKYIYSGLLEGEGLNNQMRKYSDLLEKELNKKDTRGKWTLINKKANADLRLKDADALERDVKYMTDRWPDREGTYMFRMQSAILRRNKELIHETVKQIKDNGIYLSAELKSLVRFWDGEEA